MLVGLVRAAGIGARVSAAHKDIMSHTPTSPKVASTDERTALDAPSLARGVLGHLVYTLGRLPEVATERDWYRALALAVRDRMQERWASTSRANLRPGVKVACYLSAEFLLGPHLGNNLLNLGITDVTREAMDSLGQDLDILLSREEEPGLGNGGLGRLAACYLDSVATLERPTIGYGIRYEFGIFDQEIHDGWQVEVTDKWLHARQPVGDRQARDHLSRRSRRAHRARHGRERAARGCAGFRHA